MTTIDTPMVNDRLTKSLKKIDSRIIRKSVSNKNSLLHKRNQSDYYNNISKNNNYSMSIVNAANNSNVNNINNNDNINQVRPYNIFNKFAINNSYAYNPKLYKDFKTKIIKPKKNYNIHQKENHLSI
jgi:hypothetical protein